MECFYSIISDSAFLETPVLPDHEIYTGKLMALVVALNMVQEKLLTRSIISTYHRKWVRLQASREITGIPVPFPKQTDNMEGYEEKGTGANV